MCLQASRYTRCFGEQATSSDMLGSAARFRRELFASVSRVQVRWSRLIPRTRRGATDAEPVSLWLVNRVIR